MAIMTVKEIIEATEGKLLSKNAKTFTGVSIDSRSVSNGDLFFAIKGERFDGHDFLYDALSKGNGAIVNFSPEPMPEGKLIIRVNDTLRSLQDLAHFLRTKRDVPVVAVTGSNGKTTTKEMIDKILSKKFKTLKNEGNLNNHIGLPLSLTRLETDHEVIVLEMGMNASGEIRRLCEIAVPSHGVITNIGAAHVGKLGSNEAVRDAKLEVLQGVNTAVVNADDDFLMEGIRDADGFDGQIVSFGIINDSQVSARDVRASEKGSEFILDTKEGESAKINLSIYGLFNVYNALAAAAVCFSLGMTIDEIKTSLESFSAFPMRFEVIRGDRITVINDSYNANPSSMKESLKGLLSLHEKGRAVAILGDMQELDKFSEDKHRELGMRISESNIDVFVAVGEMMGLAAEESVKTRGGKKVPEVFTFEDAGAAEKDILHILKEGDTVLVKGSRSMSMEKIVGRLRDVI
jgi:UDP-N-acetylmuramoyl-tripeptide--D-alanyl-D-alanine ligase